MDVPRLSLPWCSAPLSPMLSLDLTSTWTGWMPCRRRLKSTPTSPSLRLTSQAPSRQRWLQPFPWSLPTWPTHGHGHGGAGNQHAGCTARRQLPLRLGVRWSERRDYFPELPALDLQRRLVHFEPMDPGLQGPEFDPWQHPRCAANQHDVFV